MTTLIVVIVLGFFAALLEHGGDSLIAHGIAPENDVELLGAGAWNHADQLFAGGQVNCLRREGACFKSQCGDGYRQQSFYVHRLDVTKPPTLPLYKTVTRKNVRLRLYK